MAELWTPDDGWRPARYTAAEEAWISRRLAEASTDRAPSRRLPGRMQKAADRWSLEAGLVAAGLANATATLPPSSRSSGGRTRRASGPSDPTGAVVDATWQEVSRAAWRWAHLSGPCPLDGTRNDLGVLHECPDTGTAVDVADLAYLHVDPEQVVDALMGTPPSSTAAWGDAVARAAAWHSTTATRTLGAFRDLSQAGAEPPHLERIVAAAEELAGSMGRLAGSLADWSGRQERTCACGCGGAAPPHGEGATSIACRKRRSRERQEGAA